MVEILIPAGHAEQKYNHTFIVLLKTSMHLFSYKSQRREGEKNDGKDNGDAYYINTKTDR